MARASQEIAWHTSALPSQTLEALETLAASAWLSDSGWYLAGGTALALQVGHRSSEDLDFFTRKKDFSIVEVLKYLTEPDWKTELAREGTIWTAYRGAKVSFIAYPLFVPKELMLRYGNVAVLASRDIAVMKIVAISQRGRKRDFVDLYWYVLNGEPLIAVMRRLPEQYPSVAHDYHHILKALMYFADAEEDPMPRMNFKADWEMIKKYFCSEVPKVAKELLRL